LKAAAVALGVGWWLLTPPVATVQRDFTVPIQYVNLPPDTVLATPSISQAGITLAGSDRALDLLNPESLRLSIDVGQLPNAEGSVTLTARDLSGHGSLTVERVEPETVSVALVRLEPVELAVRVRLSGEPRQGLALVSAAPAPATVRRLVAPGAGSTTTVDTEPIDVSLLTESQTVRAALVPAPGTRVVTGQSEAVLVRVILRPN
jgi:YbbR domain-containing protein